MIELTRYNPKEDSQVLYEIYKTPGFEEFFRRSPIGLGRDDFDKIEEKLQAMFFAVKYRSELVGFITLSCIDTYGMTCQFGLLLDGRYQDYRTDSGNKLCYEVTRCFLNYIFSNSLTNKVSMRFLQTRSDIEHSLTKGGFWKEAHFKDSVFFQGKFCDELEYAITRERFARCHSLPLSQES